MKSELEFFDEVVDGDDDVTDGWKIDSDDLMTFHQLVEDDHVPNGWKTDPAMHSFQMVGK